MCGESVYFVSCGWAKVTEADVCTGAMRTLSYSSPLVLYWVFSRSKRRTCAPEQRVLNIFLPFGTVLDAELFKETDLCTEVMFVLFLIKDFGYV